jgi:hypothetical protein
MKRSRLLPAVAVAALSLQGCVNVVLSQTPLITAEESDAGPTLKPGLWADEGCDPAVSQRGCRNLVMVTGQTIEMHNPPVAPGGGDQFGSTFSYRLSGGDPLVLQAEVRNDQGPPFYAFAVAQPFSRDSQGRIDAARLWEVVCGPPPEAEAAKPNRGQGVPTDRPFPGIKMYEDSVCLADDKASLLTAAQASRALATAFPLTFHWVADSWPEAPKP